MRPALPDDFAFDESGTDAPERPDAPGVQPRTSPPVTSAPSPILAPHPPAFPAPAPAASPSGAAPAIHVSIGRVVVRAVTPPAPSRRKEAAPPNVMTLDDYLSRRKKRGRA
ncbi:hypothetical protein [Rhodocaloribacter sp.]